MKNLTRVLAILMLMVFSGTLSAQTSPSSLALKTGSSFQADAVAAAIWGMPIVAMDAMRQAYFRDAQANYNDVVYLSQGWKNQITTPNSSSIYLYFNFNTKDGPVVIEMPPAVGGGIFGTLENAWQVPLADYGPKGLDAGKGGKYLVLPPGYKGKIPKGYIQVKSETFNGYSVMRAIPISASATDIQKVWDLANKLKIYSLVQASNPPKMRFIDMRDRIFDGIAHFDETFYESLSNLINEEPVLAQDKAIMTRIKNIGIEKGQLFRVGSQAATYRAAITEAHQFLMDQVVNAAVPWKSESQWGLLQAGPLGIKTGFTYKTSDGIDYRGRAVTFYFACAVPKKLGEATFYLTSMKDAASIPLSGEYTYRLHVPANVPAQQFWAVNIYDVETAGFFKNSPSVGLDSYNQRLSRNSDGTIDIYFGAKPPMGKKENWIYTPPKKAWFAMFRFYGPTKALRDKSWSLPNIEKIAVMNQASNQE